MGSCPEFNKNALESGTEVSGRYSVHAFVEQNLPNPNHVPSVLGSGARSCELDKVCPHGADITVEVEQTNNYIIKRKKFWTK